MKDRYDLDRAEPEKLRALLAWHLTGGTGSNIHPLVKELRDQCRVPEPEEPPRPGERPCGCEDSQELQAQLTALRARNFDLAMQLSRIRKLARSPDVEALFQEVDREP